MPKSKKRQEKANRRRTLMTQEPLPYYQAARFANRHHAGTVYTVVQALIYQEKDCDLSAYRLKIKGVWHVIAIGEKPSDSLHVQIEAQLANGTLVTLDHDLLHAL